MDIKVLYFGELREILNTATESISTSTDHMTVADLIGYLSNRSDTWLTALSGSEPLRIAVNQEMAERSTVLNDGAEVALFRPVTGG